jgi:hypothetical protein
MKNQADEQNIVHLSPWEPQESHKLKYNLNAFRLRFGI